MTNKNNVYEGAIDERQADTTQPNQTAGDMLFRRKYSALTPEEIDLHNRIKDKASELADLYAEVERHVKRKHGESNRTGDFIGDLANNLTAHIVLGVRSLEDSVYRVVKALTA